VPGSPRSEQYTLELAEEHIGDLRGATDLIGEAHAQTDATDIPDTPAAGHIMFATAGHMRYASGTTGDGNYYATGRNTNAATGTLSFTTSFQVVPGLSVSLGVGTYAIHCQVLVNPPASAGGTVSYRFTATGGLTASSSRFGLTEVFGGNTASSTQPLGTQMDGSAPGGATDRVARMEGTIVVSVAGTLQMQMKQAATANAATYQAGTYIEAFPVL
jgi:hypothetical protein